MTDLFPPPRLLNAARWRGMRVGLLGGSFNPAHDGHVHISEVARRTLGLDCVWWLVSPQNPLKSALHTAPYDTRLRQCAEIAAGHPRIVVSDLERQLGTARSYDTLRRLLPRFAGTDFVWLTGFDIALSFNQWHRWRAIPGLIATAHIARPPALDMVRCSALRRLGQRQIVAPRPGNWLLEPFTAFWLLDSRLNGQSSTHMRQKGS
jgi:nicotinate-nucleotide adenylyltransferase